MAPIVNGRLLFNEIPDGYPVPGKHTVYDESQTIDLENVPLNGGLLVKTLALSIDPYLRGKMRHPTERGYVPAYTLGAPLYNFGVGVVLRSETSAFKQGDHVYGTLPFEQYFVRAADAKPPFTVLPNEGHLPWSVYVGAAGMPGQSAFYGWKEYAEARKGETVFVSTGAGPVGSMVIQLAKADGLKVIASAGSDEKVAFCKACGADVAFNYKTTKTQDVLDKEGLLNIYWDNVGGETLDAALAASADFARFVMCGSITDYNGAKASVNNFGVVFRRELRLLGFLHHTLHAKYVDLFMQTVVPKLASGEFKYTEDRTVGLDKAGEALVAVQKGLNKGKSVVIVADE